jgi:calcium binding protein
MARARDEIREQRIAMEAIVDAYGSGERAMSWYYYLDGPVQGALQVRAVHLHSEG